MIAVGIRRRALLAAMAVAPLDGLMAFDRHKPVAHRIGVTSVCFRQCFAATADPRNALPLLDLERFPEFVRLRFGLDVVEFWSRHVEAITPGYARMLRRALRASGSSLCNIQLDGIGSRPMEIDLAAADSATRAGWISVVQQWMDFAAEVGAPSLRANTDLPTPGRVFDLPVIADSFHRLAEHGRKIGIRILVENHVGFSKDVAKAAAVVRAVNDPWCRSLVDWGNSPATTTAARIADLAQLFPTLALVSAKGLTFDDAYRHRDYDVAAIVRATEAAGFKGVYSIELYPPQGAAAPPDAIKAVIAMRNTIEAALRGSHA